VFAKERIWLKKKGETGREGGKISNMVEKVKEKRER
jgi:hypothetical protein